MAANGSIAVLVIDSGPDSSRWLCDMLLADGFEPRRASPELAARRAGEPPLPAAVILDLVTPRSEGRDALAVLERLRTEVGPLPVLVLSAVGLADERVRIRRAGAAAILTKPVAQAELTVQLRELVAPWSVAPLRCGDLTLDPASGRVERAGRRLDLTPRERALLELLLRHCGEVVTRTVLLEKVWNYRFDPHTSLVDTHVSRLRRKIDDGFPRPLLHTRRRVGYKLSENP